MKQERNALSFLRRWIRKPWLWVLLGVLILAIGRVYYWQYMGPQSLNQDEAALLMNAKFIVEAGTDEWGQRWPITFRSFGDVKLPGYIYSVAGLGAVFGFAEWIVRVPSVVFGIATPFLAAALAWTWTKSRMTALLTAFFLIISPWTWHFGTIGFEANMALSLFLLALVLVFRWKNWWSDGLAAFVFLAAALTYNTPWILLPVVGVALLLWRWKQWLSLVRIGVLLLIIFVAVGVLTLPAASQKGAITIFQDPTILQAYPAYRAEFSGIFQSLLGNQYVYFLKLALQRWVATWSWTFLVSSGGGNPWHSIPGVGHLHPFVPGLAVVGLFWTVVECLRRPQQLWSCVSWQKRASIWLLVASLLPAILTVDAPHATRSLFFFVMMTFWAAEGMRFLYDGMCVRFGQLWWWSAFRFLVAGGFVWGFAWWWTPANVRWEKMLSPKWNTGLQSILEDEEVTEAERVFVWDPNGMRYPYVVLAEDMSVDTFLSTVQRSAPDTVGLVRVEQVGKYSFVFQRSDSDGIPDIYVEPNGNTRWVIHDENI